MRFARAVVKCRVPILILALLLLIPSLWGITQTRINYDMLTYLPEDMDTIVGQDELKNDFGKGTFSLIVIEGMSTEDAAKLHERIAAVDHVETVLWYDSFADLSIPIEMLPTELYDAFNQDGSTMMAVFFDGSTSEDGTLEAVTEIKTLAGEQCFVSGLTMMVLDLKELCEEEEPIYVAIAVALSLLAMLLFLDNFLAPVVFLLSIGMAILYNLGTNVALGEISFITKALSAVLQLAVTMDYSIFLWHSYREQLALGLERKEAMATAIHLTLTSVIGSSVTTIAGFVAMCFMSFTLGMDLGIVMAKGVLLGVIGCVTILPSMILMLDKVLRKMDHKALLPDMMKAARGLTKVFPIFIVVFVLAVGPAYIGYQKSNDECYYNLGDSLPDRMDFSIANKKLSDTFSVASTHMVLLSADISQKDAADMIAEMEQVEGISYVLGLESVTGSEIPREILPQKLLDTLRSDNWELILMNSEYRTASDEVNAQVTELEAILKKYDPNGMLIGEAPCMKDMITVTDHDFKVVNIASIALVFVIILVVERSISLPFILISVIELAIFINFACAHLTGVSLPFIAPICVSTIQLGATVDYAILMTTRYKSERASGKDKRESVSIALGTSIPSVIVSGMGLFAATLGVAIYSDIDMISSICMLLARGAVISMLCVILILPALLMLFDWLIRHTSLGFKVKKGVRE